MLILEYLNKSCILQIPIWAEQWAFWSSLCPSWSDNMTLQSAEHHRPSRHCVIGRDFIQVRSSWLYLGVSGKAGHPGSTWTVSRTRSVCTTTSQAILSAKLLPLGIGSLPFWWQCMMATLLGFRRLTVASYRDLANSAKPGIHKCQKPTVPRNSLPCLAAVETRILSTVSFCASESHCCPPFSTHPK